MSGELLASAAILAGGHSTRLGRDKAGLLLAGQPLVCHVAARLAPLTDDLLVVLRPGQAPPCEGPWRVIHDAAGAGGILAGLAASLQAARHDLVWVVACDMPFVSPALLARELTVIGPHDVVLPRVPLGLEPLHALYHRRCLPTVLEAVNAGERTVSRLFQRLDTRYLEGEELEAYGDPAELFFNINTPQDLAQAERRLGSR